MTAAAPRLDVVPFISAWSGEQPHRRTVVRSPWGGIGFADERLDDRDQFGVLWNGRAAARGTGAPQYGDVHPGRQRDAMEHLLCQVCGNVADYCPRRGWLWLLEDNRGDWKGWPDEALTTHPPVCLPCAGKAVRMCPHLLAGSLAVRVRESDVCAVYGRLWAPSAFGPVALEQKDVVAYGSERARWVLAGQLVRCLFGCTVVDLERELGRRT